MAADRFSHDLAEGGLAGAGLDVEAHRQGGEPQEHRAQDHPEHRLGAFGPDLTGLAEQGHAVGDGLDPGEGAASRREGPQDQEDPYRLEPVGGGGGVPELWRMEGEGMDEADDDDAEHAHDEDQWSATETPAPCHRGRAG